MTEEDLLELLPPFEARTRRHAVRALLDRMREGWDLPAAAQYAWAEHRLLRDRFQTAFLALPRPGDPARARALLELFTLVRGKGPSKTERTGILGGSLSPEAMREHLHRRLARFESEAIVGLLAASRSCLCAELGLGPLWELILAMSHAPGWRPVRAAFTCVLEQIDVGHEVPEDVLDRAHEIAADRNAPTWSQVAAIEVVARAELSAGQTSILGRLHASADAPADDIFVRAAAARALVQALGKGAAAHLAAAADDPSEYVRMAIVEALGQTHSRALLGRMAAPAREPSPRVRAAAVIALAACDCAAVATVLLTDPDELPRRIALEEAEGLADANPQVLAALVEAAHKDPVANLRRLASEAVARVQHRIDPAKRALLEEIRAALAGDGRLARTDLPPETLAAAMAVLAANGHSLSATATSSGWRIERGERKRRKLWRILHECRHPGPDKRQSHLHTVGRDLRGDIRAPSGVMGEVTGTRVPGEPQRDSLLGERGRFLPSVDDLLTRPKAGELILASPFGITRLRYPSGRAFRRARATLTLRYAEYADLRRASLLGNEDRERARFAEAVAALGFAMHFEPALDPGDANLLAFVEVPERHHLSPAAGLVPFGDIIRHAVDPSATSTSHLAAVSVAMLGLFFVRLHDARVRIKAARAAIPLSIGGWGTRGKSGTERLKAALFQALGCEVLVKTTGCEATLIHAIPDLPAREVFIYRTYDKATIWEQADLLDLAKRFGVDVFLWECMALKPEYVDILESHWMRDDFATLTNTYPDHEDIQGPSGEDVARVMGNFVPRGKPLLTAEDQMLPILADAARDRHAQLSALRFRDYALLPEDLLDRFPYQEHPRNIALVLALAKHLGIDRDLALKEMADWVVPDLGVIKRYPEATWRGRRLVFCNGMSANERAGHHSNWKRMGLHRHGPDTNGEWVMTVVNNRADRIARSHVFADIVVNDAHANKHVLIGTNLSGLRAYIHEALAKKLQGLHLFDPDELSLPQATLQQSILRRASRELQGLKLGELGAERLREEAVAMAAGLGCPGVSPPDAALAEALSLGQVDYAASVQAVQSRGSRFDGFTRALGEHGPAATAHLLDLTARHATVLAWVEDLARACAAGTSERAARLKASLGAFRAMYRDIFLGSIVEIPRSDATGDQVIDALARFCPPGFRATIMGLQNIKGTGLDFAYRWVTLERTISMVQRIDRANGAEVLAAVRELEAAEGLGILDLPPALAAIERALGRASESIARDLTAIRNNLVERLRHKEQGLTASRPERSRLVRSVERIADIYDGLWRRRQATRTLRDLVEGRISHESAALVMRELTQRQKGDWLLAGTG